MAKKNLHLNNAQQFLRSAKVEEFINKAKCAKSRKKKNLAYMLHYETFLQSYIQKGDGALDMWNSSYEELPCALAVGQLYSHRFIFVNIKLTEPKC